MVDAGGCTANVGDGRCDHSAVLVSRHVFDFLGLRMRAVGRRIHMPATMWAFVLTGLHIGLHWHIVLGKLGKAGNRAGVWLCRLVLVCVIAFGAWEFETRGLWMELFMLREFAFLEYGEPLAVFFASYAAVLYVWAALSYFLKKLLQKLQKCCAGQQRGGLSHGAGPAAGGLRRGQFENERLWHAQRGMQDAGRERTGDDGWFVPGQPLRTQ